MIHDFLKKHLVGAHRLDVLVSGYDYFSPDTSSVNFASAAENCLSRINSLHIPNGVHEDYVVHLIFASGTIKIRAVGDCGSECHTLDCFSAPCDDDYTHRGQTRFLSACTKRTLSIADVYFVLLWIGKYLPGSVNKIIFSAHAWDEGPILLNSYDPVPATPWRSPYDKDGRKKDLRPPVLGYEERRLLSRSFSSYGFAVNLGCGGSNIAKQIVSTYLHQSVCSPEEIRSLKFIAVDCWNQLFANASNVNCYGAYPGFPTCIEMNGEKPTLSVPQAELLDRVDYSEAIAFIEDCMGLIRDPWGLGLFQFTPRST